MIDRVNEPWRDTLKRLISTPAIEGVYVGISREEEVIREFNDRVEGEIKARIAVHCDPDVLEQAARKNSELMRMLNDINDKIESGELVERKRGHWMNAGMFGDLAACSACGLIDHSLNEVYSRGRYNYCPNCGAKMDEEVPEK